MSQTMMLGPKAQRASFRERVSRALDAVRSYTITGLLSSDKNTANVFGFGAKTEAGIVVTATNAFTFSAVFDAVNQGSSDIAKLPLNLLKKREDGGSEHFTTSRLYRLLKDEPNPEMSAMDFRRTLQAHAMTRHGGFAEIERDGAGRPFWLWPITPDRVERKRDGQGPIYYLIDGKDRIPARDMLDIRGLGYDGTSGYDVIDKARQAIGLALAAEKFGASFFGDGAAFPGLLGIKGSVGPDAMRALEEHVDSKYGRGSWNRFLMIDNDPSFTSFGVDPQKAQMNELRSKQVEEVARFFNFPAHKLKNLDRATNNNIEQQDLEYYKGFQLNWIVTWEQECNRKLISPLESRRQWIKHNVNAFLRGDMTARSAFYTAMLDRGVFCADDVLELEDRNPQPDGLGKMFLVQGAMVPKDQIKKLTEMKTAPPPAPTPTPDDGVNQSDVDAANDRATQAERVAEEMRAASETTARRVAELEGAVGATSEQVTSAQAQAAAEAARANTAELLAAECRRTAETVQAQFEAAEAERTRLSAEVAVERVGRQADVERLEAALAGESRRADEAVAVVGLEMDRDQALESRLNATLEEQASLRAQLVTAATDLEAARAVAQALEQQAVDAAAALVAAAAERTAAETQHATAAETMQAAIDALEFQLREVGEQGQAHGARATELSASVESARADLARLEADHAAAVADRETVTAASEARVADLQVQLAAANDERSADRARMDATARDLETATATLAAIREELDAITAARDTAIAEAERAASGLQQQIDTASARALALERELASAQTARLGQVSAEMSAHRALVADIMRRMIERETERARRHQSTPDKLRAWLDSFYDGHADLMRSALLPAVRIHLAWTGSTEDANDVARRLAERHVEESRRQIRVVLDGDADELAGSLQALLHRWDTERTTTIADQLMQKELDHVRER
jgi:HK97 family phage portal protein